jgi:hypothetical protein
MAAQVFTKESRGQLRMGMAVQKIPGKIGITFGAEPRRSRSEMAPSAPAPC